VVLPLLALGVAVVALGVHDLAKTVINAEGGGGPVSGRLVDGLWRLALRVHRARPSHRFLRAVGVSLILVTVLTWVALLWAGWWLVFLSSADAVQHPDTGQPADALLRTYYAGETLFTLGSGDLVGGSPGWQLASALCALCGLLLIGLGVAYLVPVVQAVSEKRRTASYISALGGTPHLLLERAWTGRDYRALDAHLVPLAADLANVRQRLFAYPALHYFHSLDAHDALAPRLAALDDALTVLVQAVDPELQPTPAAVEPVRHVIRSLLDTLEASFIDGADEPPPLPELDDLRGRGLPFVDVHDAEAALHGAADRRALLRGLVEHDGWGWDEAVLMRGELGGGAQLALDPSDHMASHSEDVPAGQR
jgi:hypothetical protein